MVMRTMESLYVFFNFFIHFFDGLSFLFKCGCCSLRDGGSRTDIVIDIGLDISLR